MKKFKNQKGITLVALVITIIILLILAVVALREITGDGIISKAKEARSSFETEQGRENTILSEYESELEGALSDGGSTPVTPEGTESVWAISGDDKTVILYVGKNPNLVLTSDKVQAEEGNIGVDDNGITFTGNSTKREVDINDYNAIYFYGNQNIENINFNNVLEANNLLNFGGCTNLKTIKGLDGIIDFDHYAFNDCTSLETIVLPDTLTDMPTFDGCTSLKNVNIPTNNNITILDNCVFEDCASLENIIIPNNITIIHNQAFHGCVNLKKITIPSSVTSIGSSAFSRYLEEVTINKTKAEVDAEGGIGTAWIPSSVTKIIYLDQTVDLTQNT